MVKLTRLQFIFESQFCWYYSLVCGHQGNPTKVLWIAVVTLHVWYGIPEHVHDIPVWYQTWFRGMAQWSRVLIRVLIYRIKFLVKLFDFSTTLVSSF